MRRWDACGSEFATLAGYVHGVHEAGQMSYASEVSAYTRLVSPVLAIVTLTS